jgi:hypothetical protein
MTTAAAIDRFVHHCIILELNIPSYHQAWDEWLPLVPHPWVRWLPEGIPGPPRDPHDPMRALRQGCYLYS